MSYLMPVAKILDEVKPAYLDSWEAVFAYFDTDPHEKRRVDELVAELRLHGQASPGRIELIEPDEDEDFEPYTILGNGTHRFAATVRLGLDSFLVESEQGHEEEDYYTVTEVELWVGKDYLTEDFIDKLDSCFCSSLSFRVGDEWAEMEFASSTSIGAGREWRLSFPCLSESTLDAFVKTFLARTACCLPAEAIENLTVGNVRHYDEAYWRGGAK